MAALVIKINELPQTVEGIVKRASQAWVFKPSRTQDIEKVLITYESRVIATAKLGSSIGYNRTTGRCKFEFEDVQIVPIENAKTIDYPTRNPCTKVSDARLKEILKK